MQLGFLNSWNISFVREWLPYMSLASVMRWRDYHIREHKGRAGLGGEISLQLKSPIQGKVVMREFSSDIDTFHEVAVTEIYRDVLPYLNNCRTVIDLGANIGLTSLYLATRLPDCRLFAVEPDGDNYRVLSSNLKPLVESRRFRTLNAAVWSSKASLAIDSAGDPEAHWARQVVSRPESSEASSAVQGYSMHDIIALAEFERVDFLKVDIEGAEVELFRGDVTWLQRVGTLAIEFHEDSRVRSGFDLRLKEHGFTVRSEDHHTVIATSAGS